MGSETLLFGWGAIRSGMLSRIRFDALPEKVQFCVRAVLAHRRDINRNTAYFLASASVPVIVAMGKRNPGPLLSVAGVSPLFLYFLKAHEPRYYKEHALLFQAIRDSRDPVVRALCSSFPFVVVNRNGDLVGKKRNPRIGFLPIGRRRVSTRNPPKKPFQLKQRRR